MMMGKPTPESMEKYLKFLSARLEATDGNFLLGKEEENVSIADLIIYQCLFNIQDNRVEGVDFDQTVNDYPQLLSLFQSVSKLPYVQEELSEDNERYNSTGKVI